MPLRIFEPRYVSMVRDCLKNDTGFGVCLIRSGGEVGSVAGIYPYGTLVKIVDWDMGDDRLLLITTEGVQKFRTLNTTENEAGLLIGEISLLPEELSCPIPAEFQDLSRLLKRILTQMGSLYDTNADFNDAAWVSGRLVELFPMSTADRRMLVEMDEPVKRLHALNELLEEAVK